MNGHEIVQYHADHVGVIEGADLDFQQPPEAPCERCGRMVNLESPITVSQQQEDGTMTETRMTEADARALMSVMNIMPPAIMCDQHEDAE